MGLGVLLSALLHLCVLILLIFGAPNWRKTLPEPPKPIPIDIVNISELSVAPSPKKTKEVTKIAQKKAPEPQPEPPKEEPQPEPPKEEPKPEPAPPQPPKEEPRIEKAPEVDAIPLPENKPTPPKKEEKKPEPTPKLPPQKPKKEVKKESSKKPEKNKEQPKKKDKKKEPDSFNDVLKAVEDLDATEERQPKTGEMAEQVQANEATIIGDTLSISELDALKRQLSQCWSPPSGMENAESLIVDLHVSLNPDGSVIEVKILDMSRYNSDAQFKPAADAARRAVLNPNCNPLKIPPDKYPQLKSFVLKFDPREMF